MAEKATRRRIRRWGRDPESVGECPHLSGARGVGQILQDGFEFYAFAHTTACIGGLSLIKELIFVRKDRVYNV